MSIVCVFCFSDGSAYEEMDDGESAPAWFSDPQRPDPRDYYLHQRHHLDEQEQQDQQEDEDEGDEMDPSMMMGMMMMDEDGHAYGGEENYCMSYGDYGADPNINWEERCMELEMSLQRFRDQAGKIRGLLREKVSQNFLHPNPTGSAIWRSVADPHFLWRCNRLPFSLFYFCWFYPGSWIGVEYSFLFSRPFTDVHRKVLAVCTEGWKCPANFLSPHPSVGEWFSDTLDSREMACTLFTELMSRSSRRAAPIGERLWESKNSWEG